MKNKEFNKITSFSINHDILEKGIYISRIDNDIITYDLRFVKPNVGPYLENDGLHTFEHLFATFVRNSKYSDDIIYFGPMGCRTGFYIILSKDYESKDILHLVKEMNDFVIDFVGEIPGASARDCGNYLDMNLNGAKKFALKYKNEFLDNPKEEQLKYEL